MGLRCYGTALRWPIALVVYLLLLSLFFFPRPSSAQPSLIKGTIGDSVLVLNGPWRFHPGDNMEWANPAFDDSGWGTLDLTPPEDSYDPITGSSGFVPGWTVNGYPKLTGFAWYRLHVQLQNTSSSAGVSPLAITMPINFDDAYQVFVNGQLIGQFGKFRAHSATYYNAQPRSFQLPLNSANGSLTIAIRFWMETGTPLISQDAGGLHGPPLLGESSAIDAMLRLAWDDVNRTQIGNLLITALLLLAILFGFTLYWLDRNESAYLWLGLACMAGFVRTGVVVAGYYYTFMPMNFETILLDVVIIPLQLGLWALFWAYWFELQSIRKIARITWVLIALLMIGMAMVRPPLLGATIPIQATVWLLPVALVLKLAFGILLLWITYRGMIKREADAWLALAPILLTCVWAYQEELMVLHVPMILRLSLTTFTVGTLATLLMMAIISILMMRRFIRNQRESVRLRLEIEQARQVQHVLIPEALPAIPGFAVESEYRPAQQVGGDFFQIIPTPSGGVLAVIGDVSGKGTPAAMTVSLLVGTVRTLAQYTQQPAEILTAMNERMRGRSQEGFTTCLVLRADPDGSVTLANAGHLPPYFQGKELATESGWPLGLQPDSKYSESRFQISPGERLTLLTDGIAEARNNSGELFGFERTAAIATESAKSIANTAQEFGQQDDITVLTLTWLTRDTAVDRATSVRAASLTPSVMQSTQINLKIITPD
ncbi:MAG: SpoIIE family protein phosphatase [Terracidiphilus sp.]|jgi:hypothetical protein